MTTGQQQLDPRAAPPALTGTALRAALAPAEHRKVQLLTAAGVLLVLVIAVLLSVLLHQPAYLAPAVPVVASVAFLGTFIVTGRIRHSLTVSLVLVYVTMLGFYLTPDLSAQLKGNTELAQVFSSLTPLLGTVVAFYFGADTAERIANRNNPDALTRRDNSPPEPTQ